MEWSPGMCSFPIPPAMVIPSPLHETSSETNTTEYSFVWSTRFWRRGSSRATIPLSCNNMIEFSSLYQIELQSDGRP